MATIKSKSMYPHNLHNNRPYPETVNLLRQDKQVIEIILLKAELLHDIEANIHQIERAMGKDEKASSADLLPNGAASDALLLRHIDTAVNQTVSRCQAYMLLPTPFAHRISTDHTYGWEEQSIYLGMPHNWPPYCINTLRDAIHSFIVYRTLQLFLALTDEKRAAQCDYQATLYYNEICAQLNHRLGGTKIHPTPFG